MEKLHLQLDFRRMMQTGASGEFLWYYMGPHLISKCGCKNAWRDEQQIQRYLNDILVLTSNPADMIAKLGQVFDRFRHTNLRMHPAKCHWAVERVEFLGHVFDNNGISVNENKIKIVKAFPIPQSAKQVRFFLGLAITTGGLLKISVRFRLN